MKIKTSTHNQNINLNSSLFHIIRSKLYQKFNWSTKEDKDADVSATVWYSLVCEITTHK